MMYVDESRVIASPTPAPICSVNDFLMPAFSAFGVCVWSVSWARASGAHTIAIAMPASAAHRLRWSDMTGPPMRRCKRSASPDEPLALTSAHFETPLCRSQPETGAREISARRDRTEFQEDSALYVRMFFIRPYADIDHDAATRRSPGVSPTGYFRLATQASQRGSACSTFRKGE